MREVIDDCLKTHQRGPWAPHAIGRTVIGELRHGGEDSRRSGAHGDKHAAACALWINRLRTCAATRSPPYVRCIRGSRRQTSACSNEQILHSTGEEAQDNRITSQYVASSQAQSKGKRFTLNALQHCYWRLSLVHTASGRKLATLWPVTSSFLLLRGLLHMSSRRTVSPLKP